MAPESQILVAKNSTNVEAFLTVDLGGAGYAFVATCFVNTQHKSGETKCQSCREVQEGSPLPFPEVFCLTVFNGFYDPRGDPSPAISEKYGS